MKMHKTILTLLAAMLAVIGTTGTVVQAEGPGGDDLTLDRALDSETRAMFDVLTPGGKDIVVDVWPQIKQQAPRQYWEAEVTSIVEALHTYEVVNEGETDGAPSGPGEGPTGARGASTPVANMVVNTNMYVGYTSSVTGVYVVNEALSARVTVWGHAGNSNLCENCVSVYASVHAPPNEPGHYSALGVHVATNPQGFKTTGADLDILE